MIGDEANDFGTRWRGIMSSENSVTRWIGLLKDGEHAAAQPLWDAYFQRLVALARAKLRGVSRAPPTRRTSR